MNFRFVRFLGNRPDRNKARKRRRTLRIPEKLSVRIVPAGLCELGEACAEVAVEGVPTDVSRETTRDSSDASNENGGAQNEADARTTPTDSSRDASNDQSRESASKIQLASAQYRWTGGDGGRVEIELADGFDPEWVLEVRDIDGARLALEVVGDRDSFHMDVGDRQFTEELQLVVRMEEETVFIPVLM